MVRMISVMTITARILIDNNSKQITTVVEYNLTHVYEPNLTLPHQFNIFLKNNTSTAAVIVPKLLALVPVNLLIYQPGIQRIRNVFDLKICPLLT